MTSSKQAQPQALFHTQAISSAIMARLPELKDKVVFASTCKTAQNALRSPHSWEVVELQEASWTSGPFDPL